MLETLALAIDLTVALRLQFKEAFEVATSLINASVDSRRDPVIAARLGEFASLQVDREGLRREIEQRLASAIESVVRPRRGRPPASDSTVG